MDKRNAGWWSRKSIAEERAYEQRLAELIADSTYADGRLSPYVTMDMLKEEARNPTTYRDVGEDREPTPDGWF